MGSQDFDDYTYATDNVQTAYSDAVSNALHENGHDSYNGTISTTSGVYVVANRPMTLGQAAQYRTNHIDKAEKWGPAHAIPLIAPEFITTRDVQLTVDLPANTADVGVIDRWQLHREARESAVAAAVQLHPGEVMDSITVTVGGDAQTRVGVEQSVTKGKKVTRYFVVGKGQPLPQWEDGDLSLTNARVTASHMMKRPYRMDHFPQTVEVVGITRRENGDPLAHATRTVTTVSESVTVTIAKVPDAPKVGGWYMFGWAAC